LILDNRRAEKQCNTGPAFPHTTTKDLAHLLSNEICKIFAAHPSSVGAASLQNPLPNHIPVSFSSPADSQYPDAA